MSIQIVPGYYVIYVESLDGTLKLDCNVTIVEQDGFLVNIGKENGPYKESSHFWMVQLFKNDSLLGTLSQICLDNRKCKKLYLQQVDRYSTSNMREWSHKDENYYKITKVKPLGEKFRFYVTDHISNLRLESVPIQFVNPTLYYKRKIKGDEIMYMDPEYVTTEHVDTLFQMDSYEIGRHLPYIGPKLLGYVIQKFTENPRKVPLGFFEHSENLVSIEPELLVKIVQHSLYHLEYLPKNRQTFEMIQDFSIKEVFGYFEHIRPDLQVQFLQAHGKDVELKDGEIDYGKALYTGKLPELISCCESNLRINNGVYMERSRDYIIHQMSEGVYAESKSIHPAKWILCFRHNDFKTMKREMPGTDRLVHLSLLGNEKAFELDDVFYLQKAPSFSITTFKWSDVM